MPRRKVPSVNKDLIIEDGEPFFVLRGRDPFAPAAIRALVHVLNNADHQINAMEVEVALHEIESWQQNNHTKVKVPGTDTSGTVPPLPQEEE